MGFDSNAVWGKNISDKIKAIGVSAGTPVNDTQLEAVWATIVSEHKAQLAKTDVAPGTFVAPSGGGAVTGIGGPAT